MRDIRNSVRRFVAWYIKGEYHCDKCPFCWGGNYCPGCDDYDDAGCYIRGELCDDCRLIPPVRFLLGWGKRKRSLYFENHQYDDIGEWYQEDTEKQDKFNDLLETWLKPFELMRKGTDGKLYPCLKSEYIRYEAYRIRHDYEEFAHPVQPRKSIGKQWAEVIKATFQAFLMIFKPYFCK